MATNTLLVHFTKMHGLGNDFVVINAIDQPFYQRQFSIEQLGNRYTGIGFDQLLLIETSQQADFFCRIFNADGSEAEQCGNGLRCVARFLHEQGLITTSDCRIETKAGVFPIHIQDYEHIQVTMSTPIIQQPLVAVGKHDISVISLGNPHAITKVASVDNVLANELSAEISAQAYFPNGANVGFMQVMTPNHVRLRTIERGAGETNACGSNACAAAVAGIANGWLEHRVRVEFRCGSLIIEWQGEGQPVIMTGPAVRVYSGIIS